MGRLPSVLALAGLAGLATTAAAQATPYTPTLTGDAFVRMIAGSEPVAAYDSLQREKAYSYLDGARDTSEGRIWCDVNQRKTPDLADELASQIARLPASERKKNASVLILTLLGRDLPCPSKRSRP